MTYQIDFSKQAEKQFDALPTQVQQRLQPRIDALTETPRPPGVIKMEGEENLYRIRVGNYRIIYAHSRPCTADCCSQSGTSK